MISVTLGSLTFSSDPANPLGLETLEGWYGSAPVKTQAADRPEADGSFGVSKFYKGARPITWTGLMHGSGEDADTYALYDSLAALLSSGVPMPLTVTDPGGTRTSTVMLFGSGSQLSPLLDGMATYSISVIAFDPVKYGPTVSASTGLPAAGGGLVYPLEDPAGALSYGAVGTLGRVTLTNAGTAAVWPKFTVTGFLDTGFYLQCIETGDIIQYNRPVGSGSSVTIDSAAESVFIDGVSDGRAYLTLANWFSVPALSAVTVQFNSLSAVLPGGPDVPTLIASIAPGFW